MAGTVQTSISLHDGAIFVAGGVQANDPRSTSWKPGVGISIGKIIAWSSAESVRDFLGGDGGQFSVSIPTPLPFNMTLGVNKSYGGSTAVEVGITMRGPPAAGVSPLQHSTEIKRGQ